MRFWARAYIALTMLVAVLDSHATAALAADQLVKFESAPFILGQIQQRRARERGETPTVTPEVIDGYLSKPDGNGPFPAVVYLHGCNGLSENNRDRISQRLTGWGYVSLAVDSFASRGIKNACDGLSPKRQGDAWGALRYLSKLPFVDPRRVAVVGSSQGGIVALQLASVREIRLFDVPQDIKFKAAVAFYPICGAASQQLAIPTIILIGELDDWSSAKDCEQWMGLRSGKGAPARLIVYPGAYHAFDVRSLGDGKRIFGHWLKYDADAAGRSKSEMHDFLATQLSD
jgi:dienelactone hydrolase